MDGKDEQAEPAEAGTDLPARVVEMRDRGRAWSEIQHDLGLTRQQARYAYQLGKRAERRRERRSRK